MAYTGILPAWQDGLGSGGALSAARFAFMDNGIIEASTRLTAIEPRPQTITYAATITPNAANGNFHVCVATGDLTLADPTGGTNGQTIYVLIQASGAARTLSFSGGAATPVTIKLNEWWVGRLSYISSITTWVLTD